MKISISKEWLLTRAHLEEGLEIGAGGPFIKQPTLAPTVKAISLSKKYSHGSGSKRSEVGSLMRLKKAKV